jgi:hypothetical protein
MGGKTPQANTSVPIRRFIMGRNGLTALTLIVAGVLACVTGIRAADPAVQVDPAQPPPPPPPIVRIYDVRDLLEEYRDYRIYDVARADAFETPPASGGTTPTGQSGPTMPMAAVPLSDRADELVKALEAAVAADSWRDNGGTESVQQHSGLLIVTQSAANQKLVKEFLDQLSRANSAMVRVEADWVWGSRDEIGELLPKSGNARISSTAIQEVDAHRLAALPRSVRHVHAEVTGRNGQAMFVVCGREKSIITNVTPIVSTATSAFAPTVDNIGGGAALGVKAMAKPGLGYAMLVLSGGYGELGRTRGVSAAAVAGAVFDSPATTQPATTQPTTLPSLSAAGVPPELRGGSRIRSKFNTIEMKVQELRTSIRVPLGRPTVAASATWDPTGRKDASELLLIITVHADGQ